MGKVKVGQIWETKRYGEVEIIEKVDSNNFIGRFLESGYVTKPSQAKAFYKGVITDLSMKYKVKPFYGYWRVIEECDKLLQPNGTTKRRLLCECVCGEIRKITLDTLTRGVSTNCGCVSRELGDTFHGESGTRLYECWNNMKGRCRKRGDSCNYHPDWEDYLPFKEWALSSGYDDSKILLRGTEENPDQGDYEPSNCRWGNKFDNYLDWKKAEALLKQNIDRESEENK